MGAKQHVSQTEEMRNSYKVLVGNS